VTGKAWFLPAPGYSRSGTIVTGEVAYCHDLAFVPRAVIAIREEFFSAAPPVLRFSSPAGKEIRYPAGAHAKHQWRSLMSSATSAQRYHQISRAKRENATRQERARLRQRARPEQVGRTDRRVKNRQLKNHTGRGERAEQ
jgi:hypothetical protein